MFWLSLLFFNTLSPGGWYQICNYSHAKEISVGAPPNIARQRGGAVARCTPVLYINAGLADTLETLPFVARVLEAGTPFLGNYDV
jgi:hypothetical protein